VTKPGKRPPSALIEAAMALEDELQRIAGITREAQRLPLDSQKNLERTQEKLAELGAIDERLQPLVARLMKAVQGLADEQQANAAALTARTEELRRRREVFQQLMASYAGLGTASQELNALVQAFAAGARREEASAPPAEPPSLEVVQVSMTQLLERAGEVAQAARREEFEDIARQADSLRQQLLSARNRLDLLASRHERSGAAS
jgi:chromosome segregation ATPase